MESDMDRFHGHRNVLNILLLGQFRPDSSNSLINCRANVLLFQATKCRV